MFADCQQSPELYASGILKDIQAVISCLEVQHRDPAISISALLASVEAYQSIAEEILANLLDFNP